MSEAEIAPNKVREIADVETLKALADPIRLRLIERLMTRDKDGQMPVMTVKELAAELAEPQTKLYRHVKQLEAANLIRVAASRTVSGIIEQRYQTCQDELWLGAGLSEEQKKTAEAEAMVGAALEMYRSQFFAAHRSGATVSEDTPGAPEHRKRLFNMSRSALPREEAASFRTRMQELLDDLSEADKKAKGRDDNVNVYLLAGFFCPDPAPEPDPSG